MSVHPWHDIELPEDLTAWFPAFIEIPKGSKVKYELDKATGLLRVDRVLYSAVHYPANILDSMPPGPPPAGPCPSSPTPPAADQAA